MDAKKSDGMYILGLGNVWIGIWRCLQWNIVMDDGIVVYECEAAWRLLASFPLTSRCAHDLPCLWSERTIMFPKYQQVTVWLITAPPCPLSFIVIISAPLLKFPSLSIFFLPLFCPLLLLLLPSSCPPLPFYSFLFHLLQKVFSASFAWLSAFSPLLPHPISLLLSILVSLAPPLKRYHLSSQGCPGFAATLSPWGLLLRR